MKWEQTQNKKRMCSGSVEDWDLYIDEEEEIVGVVSHIKSGWRALPFVGSNNVSMHFTKEEAQEALIKEVVEWRIGK